MSFENTVRRSPTLFRASMDGSFQIVKEPLRTRRSERKLGSELVSADQARISTRQEWKKGSDPNLLPTSVVPDGGADRDRTGDPLLAKQVLSQLSYSPLIRARVENSSGRHGLDSDKVWWVWEELNFRPHPYQGCALTN